MGSDLGERVALPHRARTLVNEVTQVLAPHRFSLVETPQCAVAQPLPGHPDLLYRTRRRDAPISGTQRLNPRQESNVARMHRVID
jgi:hypothetical protein